MNEVSVHTDTLPHVIDLFSGCGGFGAGFDSAGFSIVAGIDIDATSSDTAQFNLHNRHGHIKGQITRDLARVTAASLDLQKSKNGYIAIGGPPCQAYSRAGRGKLRSLGEHHLEDPRGSLYEEYVRLCLELDVKGIVMENVPEAIDYGGENIPETVAIIFEREGYRAAWTILNAADYGVPQTRERMILIALKKELCDKITFPSPTHSANGNPATPWQLRKKKLTLLPHFTDSHTNTEARLPWITAGDALSDLPELFPLPTSPYRLYQPNILLPYSDEPKNAYQQMMRTWYGTENGMTSGNSFRNTPRDFPIFQEMRAGDDFRSVAEISERLLKRACVERGVNPDDHPERYVALKKKIVPPYARDKFHEKWKRLDPARPSHTLPAHLGIDTYSHIHPWEPRGISVREAARLQSFPDDFIFQCSMSEAFRQIGNAVPPLLSKNLAMHIRKLFT